MCKDCARGVNTIRKDNPLLVYVGQPRKTSESVDLKSWQSKMKSCGKHSFRLRCPDCDLLLDLPVRCKLKTCQECQQAYAKDLYHTYLPLMSARRASLLTLSTPNVENLDRKHYKELRAQFARFRDILRKEQKVKGKVIRKSYKLGKYISSIETTKSTNGTYNIHLHVAFIGEFIPHQIMYQAWQTATKRKGKPVNVHVKSITGIGAFSYVLKYVSKGSDLPQEDLYKYYRATKGLRLFQSHGLKPEPRKKQPKECPLCPGTQMQPDLLYVFPYAPEYSSPPKDVREFFAEHLEIIQRQETQGLGA